jgi:hypothetical protein
MIWKFIFRLLLFLSLAVVQLSFVSGLPYGIRELNVLLIFMVFFLEVNSRLSTAWWFLLAGAVFGLYSSFLFPLHLAYWPLVFIFCRFLYSNVLTNRSLYSFLGLISLTTLFHYFSFNTIVYVTHLFFRENMSFFLLDKGFWLSLFWGVFINSSVVLAIFYSINQATNRLKPVFIFRKK